MRLIPGRSAPITLALILCGCSGGDGGNGNGGAITPIDPSTISFATQYFPSGKVIAPLPSDWAQTLFADPQIISVFNEPSQGADDQYLDSIIFARVDTGGVPQPDGISNVRQVSSQTRSVDGLTAQETIFDADVDGVPVDLRFMEIVIQQDGFVVGLLYSAERSLFNRNVEVARYIADSTRSWDA